MDGRRFDALAKALAAQRSRRGVLRGLAASLSGVLVGVMGRRRFAGAQKVSSVRQSDEIGSGFEACGDGVCRAPKTQLQNRPFQVWCTSSLKTNDSAGCTASGCRCHLYWRKRPNGDWVHAADQNVKKNIQDDDEIYKSQYDYECRCQKARADGSATVDEAAQALPDLASAFDMPEGFALDEAWEIYDASALIALGVALQTVDQMAPDFLVGFQSTVSRCLDDGPCDEVRITTIAHTDAAAASAKTEAVFYGLPATAANMTGAYLLEGVGQSQFTATYPIDDESGPLEAIHIGFHLEELSGEVMWTGSSPTIDEAKSVADEVIIALSKVYDVGTYSRRQRLDAAFSGRSVQPRGPAGAERDHDPACGPVAGRAGDLRYGICAGAQWHPLAPRGAGR